MAINGTWGLVLLAAGNSSRLGRPKQLLVFEGKTLLRRAVETALEATDKVIVVLGSRWEEMEQETDGLPVQVVVNKWWQKGMGFSIQTGITELTGKFPGLEGAIIMLCDQPLITSRLLKELAEKNRTTGKKVIASAYNDVKGTPVYFDASIFPDLLKLEGDAGAKGILKKYADQVATVNFEGGERDIDTEKDYDMLITP